MLSYRHAFHAGNHADVLKHSVLMLILESLHKKDKPFSLIDTHSGGGKYDLGGEWAQKTAEAWTGILRLKEYVSQNQNASEVLPPLLQKYLDFADEYLSQNQYPGSPEIMRRFLRSEDRLFLTELHPNEAEVLRGNMVVHAGHDNIVIQQRDAYQAIKAITPPTPRRGLLLMDPSYEVDSDYENAAKSLVSAHKRWPVGILCLWYPLLKHRRSETAEMLCSLRDAAGISGASYLQAELLVDSPEKEMGLYGSGMAIINPPWQTEDVLAEALPAMAKILAGTGVPSPAFALETDRR